MINYIYIDNEVKLSFSEQGDTLILKNNHIFGVNKINSFLDSTENEGFGVFFHKYFQYTVDGINWSEWKELNNFNISNINTMYNQLFCVRYKYIRVGQNPNITLYLHWISLDIDYKELPVPKLYNESYFSKYVKFYNHESIEWSVNILNKIYHQGILPNFIKRGNNVNWEDRDFIDLWWNLIYINAIKLTYVKIFSDLLDNTPLLKKYLIQKDLIPGETEDLGRYYYLLTHYYDEIMKRGTISIFDKNRTLPENFVSVKVRGELLRLCNQSKNIESVFGVIPGQETGWVIGQTSPKYEYNDFYRGFIRGWEITEGVEDISKYPITSNVEIFEDDIKYLKINSGSTSILEGIQADYSKSILVDDGSDYEISFKIKNLKQGDSLLFGVKAYNFLGNEIELISLETEDPENNFIETTNLEGDVFLRGIIRYSDYTTEYSEPHLKFQRGVERICPYILVGSETDVLITDIKIKLLPVTNSQSYILYNSELIIKLIENKSSLNKDKLIEIINTKLTPVHMIVTSSERDTESIFENNKYLPYTLPFEL